jgi:hypothetical protein
MAIRLTMFAKRRYIRRVKSPQSLAGLGAFIHLET